MSVDAYGIGFDLDSLYKEDTEVVADFGLQILREIARDMSRPLPPFWRRSERKRAKYIRQWLTDAIERCTEIMDERSQQVA